MKRSAFGAGIKAGGPNYVSCFVKFIEKKLPQMPDKALYPCREDLKSLLSAEDVNRLQYAYESFDKAWKEEFSVERDVSHIVGELNTFRYLPLNLVAFYIKDTDNLTDVILSLYAAGKTKTGLLLAISPTNPYLEVLRSIASKDDNINLALYNDDDFIDDMAKFDRIRACTPDLPDAVYNRAAELGMYIATEKPVAEGRIEILHYLKEQSISYEYHRYGSIIEEPKI